MRITVILLAAAIVATMAAAGSRMGERTRAARLDGEASETAVLETGEGARRRLPAVGAMKSLEFDHADAVRRVKLALQRAAAGLRTRRGNGAAAL